VRQTDSSLWTRYGAGDFASGAASGDQGVSGIGTAAKPRVRFCWVCSRQLQGNFHRVAMVDGHAVVVHADCASREKLEIVPGAHLVKKRKVRKK